MSASLPDPDPEHTAMRVEIVPIFMDNYSYLIVDEASRSAAAVDPAEPEPVIAALEAAGLTLSHVLCTHHHFDHSAGNEAIKARFPDALVVGGSRDAAKIPCLECQVDGGDSFHLGTLRVHVLDVPCHTRGHVAYRVDDALFCGDVLFVGGCGRFFEGDAADMHHSLNEVLASLDPSTWVYCGHEYTVSNLEFAAHVEPDNEAVQRKLRWAREEVAAGRPTVPSTIGDELATNPFMRVDQPALQQAMGSRDAIEVMARLREAKNAF